MLLRPGWGCGETDGTPGGAGSQRADAQPEGVLRLSEQLTTDFCDEGQRGSGWISQSLPAVRWVTCISEKEGRSPQDSGRRPLVRSSTRFLPFLHFSAMVVTVSGSGESCFLLGARISGSCMSTCLKLLLGLSPDFTQESPFMSVFVSDGYCNTATQTWFIKQHELITTVLEIHTSEETSFTKVKPRCQQGWFLLEALGENPFPCLFRLLEFA